MSKKRDPIKWVRDKAKAGYSKATECAICGSSVDLDFHHFYTMVVLFRNWCKINKFPLVTDEDAVAVRDQFIEEKHKEIYNDTVTLCHTHHMRLHSVYGKDPPLSTAEKQKRWVEIQRSKHGTSLLDS